MSLKSVFLCYQKTRKVIHSLHLYLSEKIKFYDGWHNYKHHKKVHWFTFGISFIIPALWIAVIMMFPPTVLIMSESLSITVNPSGYTNIDEFTFTINENIPDAVKYQYRTGGDPENEWFDFSPPLATSVTLPDPEDIHPNGAYTEGVNMFYFRALDNLDNMISSLSANYYYSVTPPSPPQNLSVVPSSNTQNSFSFSWAPPATYVGDVSEITYHYSINVLPNQYNTTSTSALSIGPGTFATQQGENVFYIVAEDEAGTVDYSNFITQAFYADIPAPGITTDLNIDDISDRDTNQYRLAISWMAPEITDPANFDGYNVFSSTSPEGPFTKIARTAETGYVQTNLTKNATYYYYVTSVDKTGNQSAPSQTVSGITTGRYKRPPNVTMDPVVTAGSKKASIMWVTERQANSTIEFGKTSALGQSIGNSSTSYVTDHIVALTNLEPNTTYYYKGVFIDPDGNIGQTAVSTFTTLPASIISNLTASDIKTSQITVSWETNMPSYGEIKYGETTAYGSKQLEEAFFVKKHIVTLAKLNDGQEYNLQIKQKDEEGNEFYSDNYKVSTLALPQILDIKTQPLTNAETPTIYIEYLTNIDATTMVRYGAEGIKTKEFVNLEYEKDHKDEISGLLPLKVYTFEITGRDRYGNEAATKQVQLTTLSDTMSPKIQKQSEKIQTFGEGANAEAQLIVKIVTNEPSTAIMEAKKGIGNTGLDIISGADALNTEHTVALKLGETGQPYSYRIRLTDATGNEVLTDTKTIIVPAAKRSAFDFVLSALKRSFGWLGGLID